LARLAKIVRLTTGPRSLQENIAGGIVKGISSLGSSFGEAATAAGSLADAMERISKAAQMLQAT
jgi:hypothetical protein